MPLTETRGTRISGCAGCLALALVPQSPGGSRTAGCLAYTLGYRRERPAGCLTYTALLLQIETEMAKSERKYNGAGYNSAEAEANV